MTSKFVVHGRGPFPLDMLRYDECYPDSTADAELIALSFDTECRPSSWKIALRTNQAIRYWQPCVARWASFSVSVLSC
jgi:hypothetical protein